MAKQMKLAGYERRTPGQHTRVMYVTRNTALKEDIKAAYFTEVTQIIIAIWPLGTNNSHVKRFKS